MLTQRLLGAVLVLTLVAAAPAQRHRQIPPAAPTYGGPLALTLSPSKASPTGGVVVGDLVHLTLSSAPEERALTGVYASFPTAMGGIDLANMVPVVQAFTLGDTIKHSVIIPPSLDGLTLVVQGFSVTANQAVWISRPVLVTINVHAADR